MPEHTVVQGETIVSLAHEHGLLWETIWDHENNAELRELRDHQNVLNPGDVVFIPDAEEKTVNRRTDARHRFRRLGYLERLRIRLIEENGEARADVPYRLEVDGRTFEGRTDSEGALDHPVPIGAEQGLLEVGDPPDESYDLQIGHLDPLSEMTGVKARLNNLGFYTSTPEFDDQLDRATVAAIRTFQRRNGLENTGRLDDETRSEIGDLHEA